MPTYASKVMPLLLFFQKVKSALMSPVAKFRVSLSKIYLCALELLHLYVTDWRFFMQLLLLPSSLKIINYFIY